MGDLISIDERTVKPSSFYRAYFQILTNYFDHINETVELNVASKVFKVRVCEFEPKFTPNLVWCLDEEESDSFTLDDAFEKQKLNDEFKSQGDESVESSTENLEVKKVGEGEQSPRIDVAHLEATTMLLEKVLCQDEGVTNVTLNELERQLDLEGHSTDIVARAKVADCAREDLKDPSTIIKGSESIHLIKVASSLDKLDLFGNCKESTHPTEALLVSNVIAGEDSAPINWLQLIGQRMLKILVHSIFKNKMM
ncbi:hypothetical protein V6N13_106677 [Hibiscus sabdariffa]|uniref:Uncharacterized protein n=1 Tax=Hibiscus sabdariffa TaxID=183260 RepID=A0ABR2F1H1_9ROSI